MSAKVHVHLRVSDLAGSRAFYEKLLGRDEPASRHFVMSTVSRGKERSGER